MLTISVVALISYEKKKHFFFHKHLKVKHYQKKKKKKKIANIISIPLRKIEYPFIALAFMLGLRIKIEYQRRSLKYTRIFTDRKATTRPKV